MCMDKRRNIVIVGVSLFLVVLLGMAAFFYIDSRKEKNMVQEQPQTTYESEGKKLTPEDTSVLDETADEIDNSLEEIENALEDLEAALEEDDTAPEL